MNSWKSFLATISWTLMFLLFFVIFFSKIFIPKWIDEEDNRMSFIIKGFYKEPKDSIDVLFTGNSDVYRGVSPMVLYQKYGITSYNFVSSGQRMWIGLAMLEEALRYQSPKVVFFNVDEVYYTSNLSWAHHKAYDNMRLGLPKLKALLDSSYDRPFIEKLGHIFPVFVYHDRYKELSWSDFKYAFYDYTDVTKGMDLVVGADPYVSDQDYMEKTDEIREIPDLNIEYLNKMKKLCDEAGTKLVLFEVPSPDSWGYDEHNAVAKYALENGLEFLDLNLFLEDIGIDWNLDTFDKGDHLNIYGAEKVSLFLADYLHENFDLENHKNDNWDKQYDLYIKLKEEKENELYN